MIRKVLGRLSAVWMAGTSLVTVAMTPASGPASTASGKPATSAADERRAKEAYFRDNPWSPLRGFARYDFRPAVAGAPEPSVVIGSGDGVGLRLDGPGVAPRHMRMSVLPPATQEGIWRFRIERLDPKAEIRIAREDWPPPADVTIIDEDKVVEFGPFALRPYVQGETGILVEFDRRLTEGKSFVPPAWYPVDEAWVFRLPLRRDPKPENLSVLTSLGRRKEYERVGSFEISPPGPAGAGKSGHGKTAGDGKTAAGAGTPAGGQAARTVRVHVYRPLFVTDPGESLTILFTDLTSGKETYGAGRYLDLEPPVDGLYTIDFNRAYNPLCAYTHVYNCPIPPQENALDMAVRAGEKDWPGRAHL
jgi:uncharacterized protein